MSPPRVVLSEPLYSRPCSVVLHPIEMAGVVTGTPGVGVKAVWSVGAAVVRGGIDVGPVGADVGAEVGPVGTVAAVVGIGAVVESVVAPGMTIEKGTKSFYCLYIYLYIFAYADANFKLTHI